MQMRNPVEVAKDLLAELRDKPDPSLNYIYALERLIENCEVTNSIRVENGNHYLSPFQDRYELEREQQAAECGEEGKV